MSPRLNWLFVLPFMAALAPAVLAQQAPRERACSINSQGGGGDSALHLTMQVRPGASCVYSPRAGSRSANTFSSMDVTTEPQHGKLTLTENSGLYRALYVPNSGYVGTDRFELSGSVAGVPGRGKRVVDVTVGQ